MTLFDVEELCAYWSRHPPIHVMLAAFFGVKSESPVAIPREIQSGESIPSAIVLAGMPGMVAGEMDMSLPVPIFDVAELMRQRPD